MISPEPGPQEVIERALAEEKDKRKLHDEGLSMKCEAEQLALERKERAAMVKRKREDEKAERTSSRIHTVKASYEVQLSSSVAKNKTGTCEE